MIDDAAHDDDETCLREFARTRANRAFERLVRRHWSTAYRLAHACLHDAAAAEDVAQDVFVKLARASAPELTLTGPFAPWLRTLVLNAVRDRIKRAERRRRHEERAAERRASAATAAPGAAHEADDLRREVARLPLDVRQALVLRYFDGRTHEDVARILDCPAGTASSRIRRGLEQLREQLAGAGYGVASVGALEALLLAAPAASAPPPSAAALRAARSAAVGKLGVAAALLAATVTGALTIGVLTLLVDDAPPPVAVVSAPSAGPVAATGDPRRPRLAPPGLLDGPAMPVHEIGDDAAPARQAAGPDAALAPAKTPVEGDVPIPDERVVRLAGRVLGAPAMTPLPDVELFVLRSERVDHGPALWQGEPRPLGRSDAQGEFALESVAEPLRAGQSREVTHVLVLARRPGFRPFMRRMPREAVEAGRLELVLEQAPAPQVRGRVVDPDGAPLPGLRVAVSFTLDGSASGRLLGEVAPPSQAVTRTPHVAVEVTTDGEGRFVAEGLPPGPATVSLPEGQPHAAPARSVEVAVDGPEVVVEAVASARLELQVLDATGRPCPGALVNLTRVDDPRATGWMERRAVDAQGRLALAVPPTRYRLAVGLPGAFTAVERLRGVPDHVELLTLVPGERRQVLARPAPALGAVVVHVRDRHGAPVADHEVWLAAEGEGEAGWWRRSLRRATDATGRVAFVDLPRGRYVIQAKSDLGKAQDLVVTLEGPTAEVTLEAVPRRPVEGVVRGPDGAPIAGAEVIVFPLGGGSGAGHARTDAEGRFAIASAPVEARVGVAAEGFARFSEARELDGRPLELWLTPGRFLVVRGEVPRDTPDGAHVHLRLVHVGGFFGTTARVEGGRFEATFEAPGSEGELTVQLEDGAPSTHAVVAYQERLDLRLADERGLSVRGRVEDPTGLLATRCFVFVSARPARADDAREFTGRLAPDGRLELDGLPAEPLVLTVLLEGMDVRRAAAELRFDPRAQPDLGVVMLAPAEPPPRTNALRVVITDPEGALAQAGLRAGDVVVGLVGGDGESALFEDNVAAGAMLRRLEVEPAVEVDVRRGGERLRVRLDAEVLDAERAGGHLEPCMR